MSKRVLIAEDDTFLAETIADSLSDNDYEVIVAADGQFAIEEMDKQQPDLLLLDLLMPRVDGHQVMQHRNDKGYTFPVVVLSNLSDDMNRESCQKMGCADYFIKSDMDDDDLLPLVQKYIDS